MSPLLRSRAPSSAPPQTENKLKLALSDLKQLLQPALRLGKAGVTGIGIPGVESAFNVVVELAEMVSVGTSQTSLHAGILSG
jgi:hypothetical protein